MPGPREVDNLEEILDRMANAGNGEQICVSDLLDTVGQRSFGPLLMVPGLIVASPISGIPGVPTLAALMIALVAGQILIGSKRFWLPQFLLRRCIDRKRMTAAVNFLTPVAGVVGKLVRPRLIFLTHKPFTQLIAATCVLIALAMPPLEILPFVNSITATAVAAFGLALVAHDGALAAVAFGLTTVTFYLGSNVVL
jgi:hypothetical protein